MNQKPNQDLNDFRDRQRPSDNMNMSKSQPACINPLAKAKEKRPKADKAGKSSSETWYDEKLESQSQIRYQESHTEHEKRKKELLKQLKEAEAEVEAMKDLIEKRDKLLKDSQEGEENQIISSEENLDNTNGIDPGTGQKTESSQEETARKQKAEKFTKKKIQDMKEKLLKMNLETESYLADIENTMQYLESLESASDRMGPVSEEIRQFFGDTDNEEDVIAKVYEENKVPKKEKLSNGEEMDNSDGQTPSPREIDDSQDDKRAQPENSQFFLTRRDLTNKSPPAD